MNSQTRAVRPVWMLPALLATVLALQACTDGKRDDSAARELFPLPALAAMPRLGDHGADLDDKLLLINFWATWCHPCREEMPDLQGLSDSLGPENFAVIGVSIDQDSNLAREFLLQSGIRFANFHDPEQTLSSGRLGIRVLPATYIVDPDGAILARIDGGRSWNRETLRQILGNRFAEIFA